MSDYAISIFIQMLVTTIIFLIPFLAVKNYFRAPIRRDHCLLGIGFLIVFETLLIVLIIEEFDIPTVRLGSPINTASLGIVALTAYQIFRRDLSDKNDPSLSRLDKFILNFFPETNIRSGTPAVKQETQAVTPTVNQTNQSASPEGKQASQPTTPPVNEDLLYHHAFKELEDDKKFIPTWSRAFAEAVGDEQKAKAIYIKYRVADLKLLWEEKRAAELKEAEKADRAREKALASEEPKTEVNENQKIDPISKQFASDVSIAVVVVLLIFLAAVAMQEAGLL